MPRRPDTFDRKYAAYRKAHGMTNPTPPAESAARLPRITEDGYRAVPDVRPEDIQRRAAELVNGAARPTAGEIESCEWCLLTCDTSTGWNTFRLEVLHYVFHRPLSELPLGHAHKSAPYYGSHCAVTGCGLLPSAHQQKASG